MSTLMRSGIGHDAEVQAILERSRHAIVDRQRILVRQEHFERRDARVHNFAELGRSVSVFVARETSSEFPNAFDDCRRNLFLPAGLSVCGLCASST